MENFGNNANKKGLNGQINCHQNGDLFSSLPAKPINPKRLRLLTMEEFVKLPPPSWLIPHLIPDRGLGFLIGKPAAGKSFFLLELAQAVCRGIALFQDEELVPTRKGWVLALLPEAAASWAARTHAYCDFHEFDYCENFLCCIEQNNLSDDETWSKVQATIKDESERRYEPPTLVIVDTLSASVPGQDENSQAAMSPLTSNLQSLVNQGCCVIVAHHTTKYSNSYRGSTVLLGACDWMVSIICTGDVREFRADKLRDAEGIKNTSFTIQPHCESAVCVGRNSPGPWATFDSISRKHPGLLDALKSHGFAIPGKPFHQTDDADSFSKGISLKQLQASWNQIEPIQPSNREDPKSYKSIHGSRVTTIYALIKGLIRGNILETVNGNLSRKKRNLSVIVRQVIQNDD